MVEQELLQEISGSLERGEIDGGRYLEQFTRLLVSQIGCTRATVRVFNKRGEHRCRAEISRRARQGVVHGMGIWWRKLGMDGTNVNELTSQRLTDIGRGPTFYDCLVEVEKV